MLFLTFLAVFPLSVSGLDVDDFIDSINKNQSSWKAGDNWAKNASVFLESFSGSIDETMGLTDEILKEFAPSISELKKIPRTFNAAAKWPFCHSIKEPRDQGKCGGCWAVATAAAITDRICIASQGRIKKHISTEDLLSCCHSCVGNKKENGCSGGLVSKAWKFWHEHGIVSGGPYNSSQGCKPYSKGPFLHRKSPRCKHICTNKNYTKSYKDDKHFGGKTVILYKKSIKTIQSEILRNGPVVSVLKVYQDFMYYQKGVYTYQQGRFIVHHAVKIIGWGVDQEPYWLVVNSWGDEWGDRGLFKIRMGVDECEIEKMLCANANSTYIYKNSVLRTFVFLNVLISVHKLEATLFFS